MNIFDLLRKDHDEIKNILGKIDGASAADVAALVASLRPAVLTHMRAEEEVFYSVLEDYDPTEDLTERAENEHRDVERLLDRLRHLDPSSPSWRTIYRQAEDALLQHLRQEEVEMFRAARSVLGEADLEAMGEAFIARKQRVLQGGEPELQRFA